MHRDYLPVITLAGAGTSVEHSHGHRSHIHSEAG